MAARGMSRSSCADRFGKQHLCIVKEKRDGRIGVVLGGRIGTDDLAEPPGMRELLWLEPEDIHPL
jgi:hypothetical protein